MGYRFDSYIGGIDFGWIEQAVSFSAELEGLKSGRPLLELLELLPPHRPMWVRREDKVYAEVVWIARVSLWTRHFYDEKPCQREILALVAGEFLDDEFQLYAYSMQQLALSVPSSGRVENFDANRWEADQLHELKSIHGNGFHHQPKETEKSHVPD